MGNLIIAGHYCVFVTMSCCTPAEEQMKHQYLVILNGEAAYFHQKTVECNVRPLSGFVFWQGVTLTDLKEAEKTVAKAVDPLPRNIQPVSPIVTITPAERGE